MMHLPDSSRRILLHCAIVVLALVQVIAIPDVSHYPSYDNGGLQKAIPGAAAIPDVSYYPSYDEDGLQNAIEGDKLLGYRFTSLSAFGEWPNVRYAGVEVKRSGPPQEFIHGATIDEFNNWFNTWSAQGYTPVVITAAGPKENARYAGIMEQSDIGGYTILSTIKDDVQSFIDRDNEARAHGQKLVWFDSYGAPGDPYICAIWHYNSNLDKQYIYLGQNQASALKSLQSQVTKPGWRPVRIAATADGRITTLSEDTWVGHGTFVLGQTNDELDTEWYTQQMRGRTLISLTAAGTGVADVVFYSVWAAQDIPSPRQWRATGSVTGFKDNAAATTYVDHLMKGFMQSNSIRQAQVAIGKGGVIKLERAYSWNEPEKHTTVPGDLFLLASVSKMFCEAAVQSLITAGKLSLNTKVWSLGGGVYPWKRPFFPVVDSRVDDITVQHLLDHKAGWNRDEPTDNCCDWLFHMRDISQAVSGGTSPPNIDEFVWWLAHSIPLDFTPGSQVAYSNVGYLVLSKVVQQVSGMSYFNYLKTAVLTPAGLAGDVQMWLTDLSNHINDPIAQESSGIGLSVLTPNLNDNFVADVFGGDGMFKETAIGASSLKASASTLVKFLAHHCAYGNGARCAGSTRQGNEEGAETWVGSRADGVDWAIVLNTQEYSQNVWRALVDYVLPAYLDTNPLA